MKTEIVKLYLTYAALYKIEKYIVVQSYDNTNSAEILGSVAKLLTTPEIISDYGNIFPFYKKRDELLKSSTKNFDTTNGVKFIAKGLGSSLRGINTFSRESGSSRPTLLVLDDIDTSDSTRNSDIVEKNYLKITGETLGAMSKERSRVIFLGNIIGEDGVVPRWQEERKNDENWKIYHQPIYDENGNIVWNYFTEEKLEKLKSDGDIAFSQNYLLIPYVWGETIIKREHIHWTTEIPKLTAVTIGIDPASSTRTFSDSFVMVACGHLWMRKIILETIELKGQDKGTENMLASLRILYNKWNASCVNIEFVSLQREFCEYLYNLLRNNNFAVRKIVPTKDKVARLSEHEWEFSRWDIQFLENIGNKNLVSQLLKFPNVDHDDMVDAMVYAMEWRKPPKFWIVEINPSY